MVKEIRTGTSIAAFELTEGEYFPNTNTATLTLKPSKRLRKEVSPKQFLLTTKKHPLGIYAVKTDEATQIVYGTWNKKKGNSSKLDNSKKGGGSATVSLATVGGTLFGGILGGIVLYAISSNSGNSIQSYGMHHQGTTTRAIGVFDEEFKHLPEKGVKANIYHKIDYYNRKKTDTTPLLLFKFNDTIIYGSFYPNQNAIALLRF